MISSTHPLTVVLASNNKGKLQELQQLLGDSVHVSAANELGVILPEETGSTFAENAALKADASFHQTGLISLADDSGLEVDALHGEPGVYSARYAGANAADDENNAKLLHELTSVPADRRTARFRSAIAIRVNAENAWIYEGTCEGAIGFEPVGSGGFGYDPLFRLPDGRSMAELDADEKNAISHRGEAMRKAVPALLDWLAGKGGES